MIKEFDAPNYLIAEKVKEGNFENYQLFLKAQDLNVSTLEDYKFLLEIQNNLRDSKEKLRN